MILIFASLLIASPESAGESPRTGNGEAYSITVTYPGTAVCGEVVDELERFAAGQVERFKKSFEEFYNDDFSPIDWNLEITFTHEPSPDGMVCIIAHIWDYTGGAHGNSWTNGFVYDLEGGSFLGPVELLSGKAEFEALADEVMAQLHEMIQDDNWIEDGASAVPANYHTLLPVPDEAGGAAGYRVLFPPYQVAAYVYGTFEVFVPPELATELQ